MSQPADIDSDETYEVVDALPVLAASDEGTAMSHAPRTGGTLAMVPKRQVLALAATSFLAGAATIVLANTRKTAKVKPRRGSSQPSFGEIVSSDRFLIDLHRLTR